MHEWWWRGLCLDNRTLVICPVLSRLTSGQGLDHSLFTFPLDTTRYLCSLCRNSKMIPEISMKTSKLSIKCEYIHVHLKWNLYCWLFWSISYSKVKIRGHESKTIDHVEHGILYCILPNCWKSGSSLICLLHNLIFFHLVSCILRSNVEANLEYF